jgi:putative membrane protein
MLRASTYFSNEDRVRIREAVRAAEAATSGEIVCVLATQSGDYDRAEDLVGLWFAGAVLAAAWWLMLPASAPGEWGARGVSISWVGLLGALGVLIGGFILGAAVATQVAWLRRLFTSRRQMRGEVERAAGRAFFEHGLRETEARTGILVYVSLFERMVRITGDRTIAGKLSDRDWQDVRDRIVDGIQRGRPAEGLITGIRRCGEILSEHFPRAPGDKNELANDLRIID